MSKKGLFGGDAIGKAKPGKSCAQEIQIRKKFSLLQHSSKEILKCVHLDLWGPSHVKSHGGCQYFVTFIDEVFGRFKEWKTMVEK